MKNVFVSKQRIIFVILIVIVIWSTKSYIRNKDSFQNTLIGVIDETKQVGKNSYLIKFKGTEEFNVLSKIRTKEKPIKGDSIYKPLSSDEISVYRKDKENNYRLIQIIDRK
ncbi:MAG: hypothetical protein H3C39_03960 [Flavobacteriia bacterium]|nr:hypothetical protein [Flavobacteriia bacterium]